MVAAIEQAYPQREIEQRAYEYQLAIEKKRKIIVGVNEFAVERGAARGSARASIPRSSAAGRARVGDAARAARNEAAARRAARSADAAAQGHATTCCRASSRA